MRLAFEFEFAFMFAIGVLVAIGIGVETVVLRFMLLLFAVLFEVASPQPIPTAPSASSNLP